METKFIDVQALQIIHSPLNESLIRGTHRECDLIPVFLDALRETAEYESFMVMPVQPFCTPDPNDDYWDSEDAAYMLEELFDILNSYAPDGYYFGAHPGDGSDFGYWKMEDWHEETGI